MFFTVIKSGKPFAQVANELNPQSNGGDVGWVREIDIASAGKDFVQTVFLAGRRSNQNIDSGTIHYCASGRENKACDKIQIGSD